MGRWVIDRACAQIAVWAQRPEGPLSVAVNVSGRQFSHGDLVGDVAAAVRTHGVAADLLELELTESMLMADTERTISTLEQLKATGVRISVDDFGTGYSSLAYLRRFPIDTLKIDMSFVRDITTSADAAAIVLAIVRMAHSLKLDVVAEGVETLAQLSYLRRNRCDQVQGYCFSRPLPVAELDVLLSSGLRLPEDGADAPVTNTAQRTPSGTPARRRVRSPAGCHLGAGRAVQSGDDGDQGPVTPGNRHFRWSRAAT